MRCNLYPKMFSKVQNLGLVQDSQILPQRNSFKIISVWTSLCAQGYCHTGTENKLHNYYNKK